MYLCKYRLDEEILFMENKQMLKNFKYLLGKAFAFFFEEGSEPYSEVAVIVDQRPSCFCDDGAATFFTAYLWDDDGGGCISIQVIDQDPGFLVGHTHFGSGLADRAGGGNPLQQLDRAGAEEVRAFGGFYPKTTIDTWWLVDMQDLAGRIVHDAI